MNRRQLLRFGGLAAVAPAALAAPAAETTRYVSRKFTFTLPAAAHVRKVGFAGDGWRLLFSCDDLAMAMRARQLLWDRGRQAGLSIEYTSDSDTPISVWVKAGDVGVCLQPNGSPPPPAEAT